jgi:hypothetical protein
MPLSASAASLISTGGNILGTVVDAASQIGANRQARRYATYMYDRQRADALSDWNTQTEYNSPVSQMQRLRDAHLNPNLVYGNGVVQNAPPVRSSSAESWSPRAPQVSPGLGRSSDSLFQYFDLKLREAQTDNVKQATTVGMEDAMLKRAQTWATIKAAGKTDLEAQEIMARLPYVGQLAQASVDTARIGVEKSKAEIYTMLSRNEREIAMNSASLQVAAASILRMRYENSKSVAERQEIAARIRDIDQDARIKKADADLKEQGVQPHDALWMRKLTEFINTHTSGGKVDLQGGINDINSRIRSWFGVKH